MTALHTLAFTPSLSSRDASKAQAPGTPLELPLEVLQNLFSDAPDKTPWLSPAFLHATSSRQRDAELGFAPVKRNVAHKFYAPALTDTTGNS